MPQCLPGSYHVILLQSAHILFLQSLSLSAAFVVLAAVALVAAAFVVLAAARMELTVTDVTNTMPRASVRVTPNPLWIIYGISHNDLVIVGANVTAAVFNLVLLYFSFVYVQISIKKGRDKV